MTITSASDSVTIRVNGKDVVIPLAEVTGVITELLAARKAAHGLKRDATKAQRDEAKKAAAVKKAERAEKAKTRKADRIAKLQAELVKLAA